MRLTFEVLLSFHYLGLPNTFLDAVFLHEFLGLVPPPGWLIVLAGQIETVAGVAYWVDFVTLFPSQATSKAPCIVGLISNSGDHEVIAQWV